MDSEQPQKTNNTSEEPTADWSLEIDRLAIKDSLIACLITVAGHYGRRTSYSSLTAGLPLSKKGTSPSIFIRAAERADMDARISKKPLEAVVTTPNFPCVLALNNNQACIIWGVKLAKNQSGDAEKDLGLVVQFPETDSEKKVIKFSQLKELYAGHVYYLRPVIRKDDRAGPAVIDTARDWFWGALKENKSIYSEVILAALVINLFALASPLFIMNVYDRVIPNNAFETLWVLALGVTIAYSFDFILKQLRSHFLDVAGRKADVKISARLLEQVMGLSMKAMPSSAGVLVSNMREFERLRDFFSTVTMTTLIDLPFIILFIALTAVIGGWIAAVPVATIPIILLFGYIKHKSMDRITQESMNESALKNALLFETISGLETIKVQAAEGHTQFKWEELSDKSSRTSNKTRAISSLVTNFTIFIQQMTNVLVVITGVFLIANGQLSMGALIACVILSGRTMAPLAQMASLLSRFNQSKESLRQLDDLMKREVERPVNKNFIAKPQMNGHIEFKNVTFHYPNQTIPSLKDMSFSLQAGESLGIIGAVGSGKTTIERLLLNLYQPESGSVQIDGTDVRQIDPADLRRNIGTVQQDPQLFYGTIRENITMGHELISDKAVMQAAELAGVMDFLRDSQNGLDTHVGERGRNLSGGQQRCVGIARSLLYDPSVLILDEPTASMDPRTEQRLKFRLEKLCRDKTTILITHKSHLLSMVDKIMLIDRGILVALGPRDQVFKDLQSEKFFAAGQ